MQTRGSDTQNRRCLPMAPAENGSVRGRRRKTTKSPHANIPLKSNLSNVTSRPHIYGTSKYNVCATSGFSSCLGLLFVKCVRKVSHKRHLWIRICMASAYSSIRRPNQLTYQLCQYWFYTPCLPLWLRNGFQRSRSETSPHGRRARICSKAVQEETQTRSIPSSGHRCRPCTSIHLYKRLRRVDHPMPLFPLNAWYFNMCIVTDQVVFLNLLQCCYGVYLCMGYLPNIPHNILFCSLLSFCQ